LSKKGISGSIDEVGVGFGTARHAKKRVILPNLVNGINIRHNCCSDSDEESKCPIVVKKVVDTKSPSFVKKITAKDN
jgi:hypothetical protein